MKGYVVKLIVIVLAVAMLTTAFAGCTPTPQASGDPLATNAQKKGEDPASAQAGNGEKQEVTVGVMTALSGSSIRMGEIYKAAIEAANKAIEEDGFLKDYTLKFEYVDDKGDAGEAPNAANFVINNVDADVTIGHFLTTMHLASGQFFEDAQIPVIGIVSGPASVAQDWDYTFIATGTDLIQADTLLAYLVEEKGFSKIGIANVNTEGGMSAANRIVATLKDKYSLEPATQDQFAIDDTDFTAQVLRMKDAGVEAAIYWGGSQPNGNIFMKQIEQMWAPVPEEVYFCGGTSMGQVQMLEAWDEKDLVQVGFPIGFIPDKENPQIARFMTDYQALDKEKQEPADVAARVYDAVYLIANSLNNMGSYDVNADDFTAKLRDAMRKCSFEGVQGHFDYSAFDNGEGLGQLSIAEWVEGGTYKKVFPK